MLDAEEGLAKASPSRLRRSSRGQRPLRPHRGLVSSLPTTTALGGGPRRRPATASSKPYRQAVTLGSIEEKVALATFPRIFRVTEGSALCPSPSAVPPPCPCHEKGRVLFLLSSSSSSSPASASWRHVPLHWTAPRHRSRGGTTRIEHDKPHCQIVHVSPRRPRDTRNASCV